MVRAFWVGSSQECSGNGTGKMNSSRKGIHELLLLRKALLGSRCQHRMDYTTCILWLAFFFRPKPFFHVPRLLSGTALSCPLSVPSKQAVATGGMSKGTGLKHRLSGKLTHPGRNSTCVTQVLHPLVLFSNLFPQSLCLRLRAVLATKEVFLSTFSSPSKPHTPRPLQHLPTQHSSPWTRCRVLQ